MQGLVHGRCGVAIPVFISLIDGFDRRLKGLQSMSTGGLMGYQFAEHVWWEG
jgi:peptide/nickel transport system substrate-binding protein